MFNVHKFGQTNGKFAAPGGDFLSTFTGEITDAIICLYIVDKIDLRTKIHSSVQHQSNEW